MLIKGIITEDLINYKKVSMTIMFPYCTFKCGAEYCQNSPLAKSKNINMKTEDIVSRYISNPMTEAIVMQGLEPFDSWEDLSKLIVRLRQETNDDIVIYTGYNLEEISYAISWLKMFPNIVVKFGRYIPGQKSHYDDVLGVNLASDNQFAERIS